MARWKQYIKIDLTDDENNVIKITHNDKVVEDVVQVTVRKGTEEILGFGKDCKVPFGVESTVVMPICMGGIVVNFALWSKYISHLISKVMKGTWMWRMRLTSAEVMVKAPLAEIEHRAIVDSIEHVGVKNVYLYSMNGFIACDRQGCVVSGLEKKKLDHLLEKMNEEDYPFREPDRTAMCYCPAPTRGRGGKSLFDMTWTSDAEDKKDEDSDEI